MNKLYLLLLIVAMGAVALTMIGRAPMGATAADIVSIYVEGDLPSVVSTGDEPSKLWQRTTPANIQMSAQRTTQPMLMETSVGTVAVRSLNNGEQIAFLLEWEDATKNIGGGVTGYRDSLAIQFPVVAGNHPFSDFICMGVGIEGEETSLVDIIHWRADLQDEIENGYVDIEDLFPNLGITLYPDLDSAIFRTAEGAGNPLASSAKLVPFERLKAVGFGTLESKQALEATAWGQYFESQGTADEIEPGYWRVIVTMPLASDDVSNTQMKLGEMTSIALAAWDGDNDEVDGKKSVSAWLGLEVQKTITSIPLYSIIVPITAALTAAFVIGFIIRRVTIVRQKDK
jgi:hypothetical protein